MPIDMETFEEGDEAALGAGRSQPERVLSFLAQHADTAFQPNEISQRLDIPNNSIHPVLKRLEDRDLVRHKGRYWAITDDHDRLRSLTQYELATRTLNELYGEEDPDEWAEHRPTEAEAGEAGLDDTR